MHYSSDFLTTWFHVCDWLFISILDSSVLLRALLLGKPMSQSNTRLFDVPITYRRKKRNTTQKYRRYVFTMKKYEKLLPDV